MEAFMIEAMNNMMDNSSHRIHQKRSPSDDNEDYLLRDQAQDDDDDEEETDLFADGDNRRIRKVRFPRNHTKLAQVVDHVINREDLTEEDHAALWFCSDDYLLLKSDARLETLACERDGLSKSLEDVFSEKSREIQEKLNRWVQEGEERRGLERLANPNLGNARQQAQFQAVMDVLRAQDEMLILSNARANNRSFVGGNTLQSSNTAALDVEELRKISLKATKSARHYARMIAKADALAVGCDVGGGDHKHEKRRPHKVDHKHPHAGSHNSHKDGKDCKEKDKDKKSKSKEKVKGKDKGVKEESKNKLTLKQKFKETKAGIMSRIPRIA